MNLMIVEDEIRILNSLVHNIPWEEHDIEVVATAENGREALHLLNRRKPDIVLLDIEMPELDGLSLAERIATESPHIRMIILSGHDDFTFAQRAVGLGIKRYLLKPAGEEEILQTVLEAAREVRAELADRHNLADLQHKWRTRLPQLQETFLRSWMLDRYDGWEVLRHGEELGLGLPPDALYTAVVCSIDPLTEEEQRFTASDMPLLAFSLTSIAREFLPASEGYVFAGSEGQTVLLFVGAPDESASELMKRVHLRCMRLLQVVKECLKVPASAGVGRACQLAESPTSYREACLALRERAVYGHELAIPYLTVKDEPRPLQLDAAFEKQLEIAIYMDTKEHMVELVDNYMAQLLEQAGSSERVYEQLLVISSCFVRLIQGQGWSLQRVLGDDYAYFLSLQSLLSSEQIRAWSRRVVGHIRTYAEETRRTTSHQLVRQLVETVEAQLSEDLGLHTLAEQLFVNPSYLSRLFKKETGTSFSSYVQERRMERARELLQDGAKVFDAASRVGYRDISYFAKVFRKHWGAAPSEIRK
ncbi:response regulator [Paenibacillus sp. 1P07SE]|uniref:response regulator n=1 Tax=Paenibacillus sp. 1P07SE TaxID=3132209 RepID=UPI0039A42192